MITLRWAKERHYDRRCKQEAWVTFYLEDRAAPPADGFGALEILNEDRVPPRAGVPRHRRHDAEIVTYVRKGALAYEDSMGRSGVIHSGEFHHMTAGRAVRHSETNASRSDWAHVFQIWLRPSEAGRKPSHEQKRFIAAERRGGPCVVASPDDQWGWLCAHQDALLYSSMLRPAQHVIHEFSDGRSAWLHLVEGEALLGDIVLTTGDGAASRRARALSLRAGRDRDPARRSWSGVWRAAARSPQMNGGVP